MDATLLNHIVQFCDAVKTIMHTVECFIKCISMYKFDVNMTINDNIFKCSIKYINRYKIDVNMNVNYFKADN